MYKKLRSKGILSQLQNSGFGGRSKFGRIQFMRQIFENQKFIKENQRPTFSAGRQKINRGT
jgi:hypothetical protein